jgi:hypothetical protein
VPKAKLPSLQVPIAAKSSAESFGLSCGLVLTDVPATIAQTVTVIINQYFPLRFSGQYTTTLAAMSTSWRRMSTQSETSAFVQSENFRF